MNYSVQIICEGQCFLCKRCERSPAIRKLFIDTLSGDKDEKTDVMNRYRCPLCEKNIPTSTVRQLKRLGFTTNNTGIDLKDMFEIENPLMPVLKRFRQTYKDNYMDVEEDIGNAPPAKSSYNDLANLPLVSMNKLNDSKHIGLPKSEKKMVDKNTAFNPSQIEQIAKADKASILELIADCYCTLVSSLQKNRRLSLEI